MNRQNQSEIEHSNVELNDRKPISLLHICQAQLCKEHIFSSQSIRKILGKPP